MLPALSISFREDNDINGSQEEPKPPALWQRDFR